MTHVSGELRRHTFSGAGAICAVVVCLGLPAQSATAPAERSAIPNFAPDDHTSWYPPGQQGDNFLPPKSGPGPVMSAKDHPYVPNGGADSASSDPTYRIADLSNPILKPWVVAQMKRANDEVLAGKVPFMARERCWPGGVPEFDIYRRVAPPMIFFIQTPKEVLIVWRGDQQVRRVYLNMPHSAHPKPSWYGESVGHYEGGDTLVVDTIGQNTKTFVDNYRTPHTEALHVVERFQLLDGGKNMEIDIHVEDPGAFNMPWNAVQKLTQFHQGTLFEKNGENICAENNVSYFDYDVAPMPQANKPDF